MGRIAYEWQRAFEHRGFKFEALDTSVLFTKRHALMQGFQLRRYLQKHQWQHALLLVHEPLAGWAKFANSPMVVFSHGIEQRAWAVQKQYQFQALSAKAKLLPEGVRFWSNNRGFKQADGILLSNRTDQQYLQQRGFTKPVMVFNNGIYPLGAPSKRLDDKVVLLWNATWLPRKGISLLVAAFNQLLARYPQCILRLAGTSLGANEIRSLFLPSVQEQIEVIDRYRAESEVDIYSGASIFLMPSYFEGQSLALHQAMAMGLCAVAANNSGQTDLIQHGIDGLLFETGHATDFYNQVEYLLLNKLLIAQLGGEARKKMAALQWPQVANQVVDFCAQFIGRKFQ